jgi:uncharacterized membrane protein
MNPIDTTLHFLGEPEEAILHEMRVFRRAERMRLLRSEHRDLPELTIGQRVADSVAATVGSWRFIIIQSLILLAWIVLNVTAYVQKWDPYPFILLNLALSFQAAYAAPFIMMSQNRQQDIDRKAAEGDYKINIKAERDRAAPPEARPTARKRSIQPDPIRCRTHSSTA